MPKKRDFLKKLSNLELWCLLTTYRKLCNWAFQRTHYWIPENTRRLRSAILKIDITSFFSAEGGPIWIKFCRLVRNDMSTAPIWSKSKPDVKFQYEGRLGDFRGMSSQSLLPHCRVQSPGEINVMIVPHSAPSDSYFRPGYKYSYLLTYLHCRV